MADPRIAVQIAAVDKFTATLNAFRKDLDRSGGAVSTMNRRMGAITLPSLDVRAITRQAEIGAIRIRQAMPNAGAADYRRGY